MKLIISDPEIDLEVKLAENSLKPDFCVLLFPQHSPVGFNEKLQLSFLRANQNVLLSR